MQHVANSRLCKHLFGTQSVYKCVHWVLCREQSLPSAVQCTAVGLRAALPHTQPVTHLRVITEKSQENIVKLAPLDRVDPITSSRSLTPFLTFVTRAHHPSRGTLEPLTPPSMEELPAVLQVLNCEGG